MRKSKQKICFVTGSRAEYGLLLPLMKKIIKDDVFNFQLVVTGMHLSKKFGNTLEQIRLDGIKIDSIIDIDLRSDTPSGISRSMGLGMIGFGKVYEKLKPNMVVVLGDRFEIMSAVSAAHVAGIPVAHLHGGEVTEGAIDDAFRHCITKMSYLHFTSTEEYRERVIQLGEAPDRVFNVGAIGIHNIEHLGLLSKKDLEKQICFKLGRKNILITYHPVTLEGNVSQRQFQNILNAIDGLKDTKLIFTKANADTYGKVINDMIDAYIIKNKHKAAAYASLGQLRYLSLMKYVDVVLGNSSSSIIEAPSFNIPTVNIGDRQKGRLMPQSVICCSPEKVAVERAVRTAYSKSFRLKILNMVNPYYRKDTVNKINSKIKIFLLSKNGNMLKKEFYNTK